MSINIQDFVAKVAEVRADALVPGDVMTELTDVATVTSVDVLYRDVAPRGDRLWEQDARRPDLLCINYVTTKGSPKRWKMYADCLVTVLRQNG